MIYSLTPRSIHAFQTFIFDWWNIHRRDLPWRNTRDPYKILVSEMMLQQTQVARVILKYEEFLEIFPTIRDLAQAPLSGVLQQWKGLGYNRRAKYLWETAKDTVQIHGGIIPAEENELFKLPGLGKYTVRALLVFAFEQDVALVDTNIRKIIEYYFADNVPQKAHTIDQLATQLIPHGRSWSWYQALMDYGALVMPQLIPKKKHAIPSTPFKQTHRYIRGRIIDRLRTAPIAYTLLVAEMSIQYSRTSNDIRGRVQDLEKEGLLVQDERGVLRLPDS